MSSRTILLIPFLLSLGTFELTYAQTATERGFFEATSRPSSPEKHGPYYAPAIEINHHLHLTNLSTALDDANAVAKALREQHGFEARYAKRSRPSTLRPDLLLGRLRPGGSPSETQPGSQGGL